LKFPLLNVVRWNDRCGFFEISLSQRLITDWFQFPEPPSAPYFTFNNIFIQIEINFELHWNVVMWKKKEFMDDGIIQYILIFCYRKLNFLKYRFDKLTNSCWFLCTKVMIEGKMTKYLRRIFNNFFKKSNISYFISTPPQFLIDHLLPTSHYLLSFMHVYDLIYQAEKIKYHEIFLRIK
jgi:hypothetical protein